MVDNRCRLAARNRDLVDFGLRDANEVTTGDVIALQGEHIDEQSLLHPVMQGGQRTGPPETPHTIRSRLKASLNALPEPYQRLEDAPTFPITRSEELNALKRKLQARKKS